MAHRKAGGTTKNDRDSNAQYLGVKLYSGQTAKPGSIIVRQRGTKFIAGENVGQGKDYTLFSLAQGKVKFTQKRKASFGKKRKIVSVVNVLP